SASRTRRQMIQRMGRVLRRKPQGVGARFVILFAADTLEDPTTSEDRDGFLDEIEAISDQVRIFGFTDIGRVEAFLDWSGPEEVREPARVNAAGIVANDPDRWDMAQADGDDTTLAEELERGLGAEAMYAKLNYLQWPEASWLHQWISARVADAPRDAPVEEIPYLELERLPMPELAKPKRKKKLLSTGDLPVVIADVEDGFALRCTGCGVLSESVKFKWQALNQTVECECSEC
ncbi:MAG: hypothetical protein ACR2OD_11460, partial [Gaiellaceae bacterium]